MGQPAFTFQIDMALPSPISKPGSGNIAQIPIPAGKRLVIEFLSFSAAIQSVGAIEMHLTTSGHPTRGVFYFALSSEPVSPGNRMLICSQVVRIYADGPQATLTVDETSLTGQPVSAKIIGTVSGYLEDL